MALKIHMVLAALALTMLVASATRVTELQSIRGPSFVCGGQRCVVAAETDNFKQFQDDNCCRLIPCPQNGRVGNAAYTAFKDARCPAN